MPGSMPHISNHEQIVPECEGCEKIHRCINGKLICSSYICPRIMWWCQEKCPDATHINHDLVEDPVKEP